MFGKRFEKELEMIEDALLDEQSRENFKEYMRPLVETVADKYAATRYAKGIPKAKLIEAGWTHFDIAMRKYQDRAKSMVERENELFYFSTYFTWYIRQGIIEYLNSR